MAIAAALPDPLSFRPGPSSTLSRWPPIIEHLLGSVPASSATTLVVGPCGVLTSWRVTAYPAASSCWPRSRPRPRALVNPSTGGRRARRRPPGAARGGRAPRPGRRRATVRTGAAAAVLGDDRRARLGPGGDGCRRGRTDGRSRTTADREGTDRRPPPGAGHAGPPVTRCSGQPSMAARARGSQSSRKVRQRVASSVSSIRPAARPRACSARRKPWFGTCSHGTGPWPRQPGAAQGVEAAVVADPGVGVGLHDLPAGPGVVGERGPGQARRRVAGGRLRRAGPAGQQRGHRRLRALGQAGGRRAAEQVVVAHAASLADAADAACVRPGGRARFVRVSLPAGGAPTRARDLDRRPGPRRSAWWATWT